MALNFITALRNNMLDEITGMIDGGAGDGFFRIYSGTKPSTGGTATTLLAELLFASVSAPAASNAALTFNAIVDDSSANASGTASWCRCLDSAGTIVLDGDATVTGGGGFLELDTLSINSGQTISITSMVINAGNA